MCKYNKNTILSPFFHELAICIIYHLILSLDVTYYLTNLAINLNGQLQDVVNYHKQNLENYNSPITLMG